MASMTNHPDRSRFPRPYKGRREKRENPAPEYSRFGIFGKVAREAVALVCLREAQP